MESTQTGAVLVFKPGVTKEEAAKRLEALRDIVDLDYYYPKGMPRINEFNPEHGGPVWYLP